MRDDKELIAGIIGAISTIPSEVLGLILVKLGYAKYSIYQLSSMLITVKKPSIIIGMFVSPIVGAIVAVLLFEIFGKLGSNHLIIKCIVVSIFMWINLEFVFTAVFEQKILPVAKMSANYSHLVCAIFDGIIEGILFKVLLFNKKKEY